MITAKAVCFLFVSREKRCGGPPVSGQSWPCFCYHRLWLHLVAKWFKAGQTVTYRHLLPGLSVTRQISSLVNGSCPCVFLNFNPANRSMQRWAWRVRQRKPYSHWLKPLTPTFQPSNPSLKVKLVSHPVS